MSASDHVCLEGGVWGGHPEVAKGSIYSSQEPHEDTEAQEVKCLLHATSHGDRAGSAGRWAPEASGYLGL